MLKSIFMAMLVLLFAATTAWSALNINTATKEQLQKLAGIGPSKAETIIQYRTNNGPFKKIEDLAKVKGIGAKTVEKLREEISVSDN